MKDIPKDLTLCQLEVLVMPNGEILCAGKVIGYFKEFKKYIKTAQKSLFKKK